MKRIKNTIMQVIIRTGMTGAIFCFMLPAVSANTFHYETNTGFYSEFNPFEQADSLYRLYSINAPEVDYFRIIRMAVWSEENKKYDKALIYYSKALEIDPADPFLRKQIDELTRKSERKRKTFFFPWIDFEKSSALILVLVIVIIYSALSMIILLVIILFHRNLMEREARKRQDLKERYQALLMDFLFEEEETTEVPEKINAIAANRFNRVILMEEMRDLTVNLSGDAADKMRDLYYKLNLNADSKAKTMSRKWHIKIKGFRELAFMNVKDANEEIFRCLDSRNDIMRMEAQLALVRLNDDDRFSFLDHLQRPFTKWEQLNVHEMIVGHNLEVPDFDRWLVSGNKTVVIFALKMIRVFKQKRSWEKITEQLDCDDPEIRKTAITVLGELRIRRSVSNLKKHYKYEVYENQLEILIALGKIADESVLGFLVKVIDKEDDVQLQIEAAKALRDMGKNGENALQKLMVSDYKNYKIIIKHVLDKRI